MRQVHFKNKAERITDYRSLILSAAISYHITSPLYLRIRDFTINQIMIPITDINYKNLAIMNSQNDVRSIIFQKLLFNAMSADIEDVLQSSIYQIL